MSYAVLQLINGRVSDYYWSQDPEVIEASHLKSVSDGLADEIKSTGRSTYAACRAACCFVSIVRLMYLQDEDHGLKSRSWVKVKFARLTAYEVIQIIILNKNEFAKTCAEHAWTSAATNALCELFYILVKNEGHGVREKIIRALSYGMERKSWWRRLWSTTNNFYTLAGLADRMEVNYLAKAFLMEAKLVPRNRRSARCLYRRLEEHENYVRYLAGEVRSGRIISIGSEKNFSDIERTFCD